MKVKKQPGVFHSPVRFVLSEHPSQDTAISGGQSPFTPCDSGTSGIDFSFYHGVT